MIFDETWDFLRLWQYAERYLGVGTRDYSAFSHHLDISDEFHPQRGRPRFVLPTFRVPDDHGAFLPGGADSPVTKLYRGSGGEFLLPVHPETLRFPGLPGRAALRAVERGPDLLVVPSANARTVFVERIGGRPVEPHFVKLHYPRRLSRFTRRLRRPIITLQLWAAAELMRAGLPVLPEVAGGVLGEDPREAWGFLIRELSPRATTPISPETTTITPPPPDPARAPGPGTVPGAGGPAAGQPGAGGPGAGLSGGSGGVALEFTVPLFALYGRDLHHPGHPPLLRQLVARSGEDPFTWIIRRVVAPMVGLWLDAVARTGCLLEPHGQNTLFSFDRAAGRTAIVYRDCGVYVDLRTRHELSPDGPLPPVNVIPRDIRHPREQVMSLTYDSFLAHHALERIARLARDAYGIPPGHLRRAACDAFLAHGGAGTPLPPTVYYYDDRLHDDGRWNLVDTGEPPHWRPPATRPAVTALAAPPAVRGRRP
ncbi:IucA/IucC family C-terminal-domain containing protein [Nonomuraea candida]|uniref:IucA/IucC family C-terminal-domain containing protein n=1 Tax=Nonomuraea candida TaxID=359159 RepID=UPI0005BAF5D9|nr:IucA/IucC family C-terminal-domain containing protein [Nonomuraea candida]